MFSMNKSQEVPSGKFISECAAKFVGDQHVSWKKQKSPHGAANHVTRNPKHGGDRLARFPVEDSLRPPPPVAPATVVIACQPFCREVVIDDQVGCVHSAHS